MALNNPIETYLKVALMTNTFAALAARPETVPRAGAPEGDASIARRRAASPMGGSEVLGAVRRRRRAAESGDTQVNPARHFCLLAAAACVLAMPGSSIKPVPT